jgi:pSer/pThr/pTyr-binding forkhead associated (FHA) protein
MNAILALVLRITLLVLTYLFVGWIGYTIYQDLRSRFYSQTDTPTSLVTLRAVLAQEPLEKQFQKPEIILGRDPDCDFILTDETISLRHCKLSFHHKQWWANDLNSTNGTLLNNNLIDAPTIITDGDEIRLGKVSVMININP